MWNAWPDSTRARSEKDLGVHNLTERRLRCPVLGTTSCTTSRVSGKTLKKRGTVIHSDANTPPPPPSRPLSSRYCIGLLIALDSSELFAAAAAAPRRQQQAKASLGPCGTSPLIAMLTTAREFFACVHLWMFRH